MSESNAVYPEEKRIVTFELQPDLIEKLTQRQKDLLFLTANDLTMPEIKEAMGITMSVARGVRSQLYKKLKINTVQAATKIAIRSGLFRL